MPLATIAGAAELIVELIGLAVPEVNSTMALSVMAAVFTLPVMVAVPIAVGAVRVALYVPLPLSVTGLNVPAVVVNTTASPPLVRFMPFESIA